MPYNLSALSNELRQNQESEDKIMKGCTVERKLHKIKIREEFADDVFSGNKCFEVRENDRGYQKGDLIQFETVESMGLTRYHKLNDVKFEITYVLSGWGIKNGYVAFGIRRTDND